ncbi:DUF2993 domain-containing protein [Dolichospermum circinale]|uniref:LmeA family phospholipid-binding protein n=1 Tax=Dolichospermum circinale TaxID=109265 RepID=UPI000428A6B2|nr:DUF2993 domain-containing protein [Dolichospermum circinale]MDB9473917.1 DUF2993 domain-containing protein [Dolichospermum circinale CS-537/11]MDB9477493.1 DUF2993 domain-containing protein [Dolichospermum circinale CS-537/03]MDB9482003.1 DUF2993 domain-containing protein [Dolichospermum circinale CS-537/05]
MIKTSSPNTDNNKVKIITKVLTSAIKLWLRTQLSHVSDLDVQIKASDRQFISGSIPGVSIYASKAVYQGLHITEIELYAEKIQLNVSSILRGQPLKLSAIVPVVGKLIVEEQDLNNSLSSPLLLTAISDLLIRLLPQSELNSQSLTWRKITFDNQLLILHGTTTSDTHETFFNIHLDLKLLNGQELQFTQVEIKGDQGVILERYAPDMINLGTDVDIQEISLKPGQLTCYGRININP